MVDIHPAARSKNAGAAFLRPFLRNNRANVSIMFGLLLVPMIGAVGLAVDFGQALTARNKAQVAADAAALQAAGVAKDLIQQGDGSATSTTAALNEAKTRAKSLFDAYAIQHGISNYTFDTTVKRTDQNITATASYSLATNNFFGQMFGQGSFTTNGNAQSSSSLPTYADVYVSVDVSQSMGLGATNAEMIALYNATSPQCVFGCHVPDPHQGNGPSNQAVAKAKGIKLRIDVLREAIQNMISAAKKDAGASATYQFGLYTMGANPSNNGVYKLTELTPLTDDYTQLTSKAVGIDLGPNNSAGQGDSYFTEPLRDLSAKMQTAGDGSSRSKAKGFVFIMTDGVKDMVSYSNCASGSYLPNHCMGTIEPSDCKAFKDKKLTVAVLYTTYLPVYNNPANTSSGYRSEYFNLIYNNGLYGIIASKLKDCASPGWFFEAADTTSINNAMRQMFEQITVTPMLVN